MAQKNFINYENTLNDINVSRFNSAFFLSPIELISQEPNKENNYLKSLENQSLKIEDDIDHIVHKKDNQTPKSIDNNLKKCLGQDLLKHLDESPMRQHKFLDSCSNQLNAKNSFFFKKNSNSSEESYLIEEKVQSQKFAKIYKIFNIPGSSLIIVKKKFEDDFFLEMPLKSEESYFIYERFLVNQISNFLVNKNNFTDRFENENLKNEHYYQNSNSLNIGLNIYKFYQTQKFENLKKIINFGKIFDITIDSLFVCSLIKKSKSFYLDSAINSIKNSSKASLGNFYLGIEKEKQEEELINLNNSDEFKNEFLDENKNFNNFNFSQQSHNESSACKNINNISENKRVFGNSNFEYDNENEENNIYSSIFSNDFKIKKSNSTNFLGEIENKIPYDPELYSTENNDLEKIFHSPNFYNFNQKFSKDKNTFEEDNNINYNKIFKKNSFSNSNLKKLENPLNTQFQHGQEKYIGLSKVEQEESQNPNKLENLNLKSSNNIKNNKFILDKRHFDESTSAYSDMQNHIPSYTPNPDFSREIHSNNLINKNKNSFLYPNYSDFSDALNIPNIQSSSNSNKNVNPYSSKRNYNNLNNTNKNNNNEIIYEHQNDYESDNYGMSNFEVTDKKKDLYGDFEGENLINNFLNDEVTYTPNRRDKNDESFDNRNYETFDCCNIDSFINPTANINNTAKSSFTGTNNNNYSNKKKNEDTILQVSDNNFNNSNNNNKSILSNRLNEIIDKKYAVTNNDFGHPKNPFSFNNQKLNSENLAISTNRKPALIINDEMCFYPKSIRNGIPSGNISMNKFGEFSNENINNKNANNKNDSFYNIIDNFKNFTNLSENNLRNTNRNPMNPFMSLNNSDLENKNNFSANNSNKTSANNLDDKIDLQKPLNKKEEINFNLINNNGNQIQQKIANQNNIMETTEESTPTENFKNNPFYNQNKTQILNTQSVNKMMNQGSNIQVGEKQSKQVNPNSQNKTGWVCSQCKNFNYESNKNNFFLYFLFFL